MSTIATQPSTATVQGFYDALARGDIDEIVRLCSPDLMLDMPGDGPLSGLFSGRDAALGVLGKMRAASGGTYRAELRGLYTAGDHVIAVHHGTGTNGEKVLDADAALAFVVADGAIASIKVHQARQDNWDDFFS